MAGHRVLVLNATYEPLSIVSMQRALILVLKEKAELLEAGDEPLRSPQATFPRPLVIRLLYYVRVPHLVVLSPNRRSVMARDNYTCQYCGCTPGSSQLTLDHVLPRSRGGLTTWENVVTACRACNLRKGQRTPEEAGMELRRRTRPSYLAFLMMSESARLEIWEKYAFS